MWKKYINFVNNKRLKGLLWIWWLPLQNIKSITTQFFQNKMASGFWLGWVLFFSITMFPSTLLMPVKSYLRRKTGDKTLTVMDWPPQSSDMNIIEAVWDHLDREINKGQPNSKEELVLKEAEYNIPEDYKRKLSKQSPKTSSWCAKGGHTKYWLLQFCSENVVFLILCAYFYFLVVS